MRFGKPNPPTKVNEEQRRLAREQVEIRRKQELLEKQLKSMPKQIEAKRKKERDLVKLNVAATASYGAFRPSPSQAKLRQRKTPVRELNAARLRFLGLCIILATIIVLLWRVIPS